VPGSVLVVFFFPGCFVNMTDGCHVRACQDLEMLIAAGQRVAVYSYRNHVQWPWGPAEIDAFHARFPDVKLVLDEWTPVLALSQKIKSIAAYLGGKVGVWIQGLPLPGLTPGLDGLRRDGGLKLAVVSYPWGVSQLNGRPAERMIIDTHDLSALERIQGRAPGRLGVASLLSLKRELFYLSLADEVWSISYGERWFLQAFLGGGRVRLVPPALSKWTGPVPKTDRAPAYDLVFVGSNNRWNGDAITSFLKASACWEPSHKIAIAGSVCRSDQVRAAARPGVELLGYVDDLNALYSDTRAAICPVEETGTKIKLIEALRAGRPVFAAPGALTGLVPGYEDCVFPLQRESIDRVLGNPASLAAAEAAARRYSEAYRFERVAGDVRNAISHWI
jgi:glycosyltransferase involved in cell wall biosynthesis